ncbi:MAG: hypothetical protein JO334_13095, partial [Verrucomicrobia bacterium]|nr:hypothetical protein [Verrucomicrobiota bacterium]
MTKSPGSCDCLLRRAAALLGKPGGGDHLTEGDPAIVGWHPLVPVRAKPGRSQNVYTVLGQVPVLETAAGE